jgi:hypothetical protein
MPTLEELQADLDFYKTLKTQLENALLQGATQLEISIAGRTVRYRTFEDMIRAKQWCENEIDRIERAIALVQGEKVPANKIRTRFVG